MKRISSVAGLAIALSHAVASAQSAEPEAAPAESAFYGGAEHADALSETLETPALELYGFVDFTYTKNLDGPDVPYDKFPSFGSFAVGNINLYAASNLGGGFRSLLEVRYLYLPHGGDQGFNPNGSVTRVNASAPDYTEAQRPLRWGGVELERVFLEYQATEWLAFQLGQFLTPYGIWNIDHGSPTVIPVRRPFVIGEELFPERQTGIEAHGSFQSGDTALGYHLTFSNGKGPIDAYLDLDDNNAVGGRLFVRNTSAGTLTVGASTFYGKFTDRDKAYGPNPDVTPFQIEAREQIVTQFDELSFGFDARYEWNRLLLQSEVIVNQRKYVDPYRRTDPGGVLPDEFNFGGYALVGFRTPWFGIMPYTLAEYYNFMINTLLPPAITTATGLNIQPQPNVVFKLQYQYTQLGTTKDTELLRGTIHQLDAQAAWAF